MTMLYPCISLLFVYHLFFILSCLPPLSSYIPANALYCYVVLFYVLCWQSVFYLFLSKFILLALVSILLFASALFCSASHSSSFWIVVSDDATLLRSLMFDLSSWIVLGSFNSVALPLSPLWFHIYILWFVFIFLLGLL